MPMISEPQDCDNVNPSSVWRGPLCTFIWPCQSDQICDRLDLVCQEAGPDAPEATSIRHLPGSQSTLAPCQGGVSSSLTQAVQCVQLNSQSSSLESGLACQMLLKHTCSTSIQLPSTINHLDLLHGVTCLVAMDCLHFPDDSGASGCHLNSIAVSCM